MDSKIDEQKQFRQMWIDAQVEFQKRTKQSLPARELSLDNVHQLVEKHLNADDPAENKKQERIRRFTSNIITIIEVLGGVAAQGASIMFSPAGICFNALEFLLRIPDRISDFYDEIATLFEEISEFATRFKVYQRIEDFADPGAELRLSSHKMLILFVDICAILIDVLNSSKARTFKYVAKKALFDDDSGIKDRREKFERLVNQQGQLSGAITLEHVLKSEHNRKHDTEALFEELKHASEIGRENLVKMDDVQDTVKGVKSDTSILATQAKESERFNKICDKLRVSSDTPRKAKRDLDSAFEKAIPETCTWPEKLPEFEQWLDFKATSSSILLIEGDPGTGKSVLAYTLLNKIKDRFDSVAGNATRVLSASFRYERGDKRPEDILKQSLKSMATQIAQEDQVYATRLMTQLDTKASSSIKDMRMAELAEQLSLPPGDVRDVAYVLLFDGLDALPSDEEAKSLIEASLRLKSPRLKIMMTGTGDCFRNCFKNLNQTDSIRSLKVAEENSDDIQHYINLRVNECKVLKGVAPNVLDIKNAIFRILPDVARGNFGNVDLIVRTVEEGIRKSLRKEDIIRKISTETILYNKGATQRLISELNSTLNIREIEELNELLIWTIYAADWINEAEMEAVLYLLTQSSPIQTLSDKVGDKYQKLLEINSNQEFDTRNQDVWSFFEQSKRPKRGTEERLVNEPKISMTVTIDQVQLSKAQRFFWDLSEQLTFDKFNFQSLAAGPEPTQQRVTINADSVSGHVILAQRCFALLSDEPVEQTSKICWYALRFLPYHLWRLNDYATRCLLHPSERETVISDLVSLLQSPGCIEAHLNKAFFNDRLWLDNDDLLAIQDWLADPCTDTLGQRGRMWVKQVKKGGPCLALKELAALVARHWLCRKVWPADAAFNWMEAYLDQLSNETDVGENRDNDEGHVDARSMHEGERGEDNFSNENTKENLSLEERIRHAAQWSEEECSITKSSLWFERVGETYLRLGANDLAIEAFNTAKGLPGASLSLSELLADAYYQADKTTAALEELQTLLSALQAKQVLTNEEETWQINIFIKIAKHQVEIGRVTEAIEQLQQGRRMDMTNIKPAYELLRVFLDKEKFSDAFDLISEMQHQPTPNDHNQLESLILDPGKIFINYGNYVAMFRAGRDLKMFEIISETFRTLTRRDKVHVDCIVQINLLLYLGRMLARYGDSDQRTAQCLDAWRECWKLALDFDSDEWDEAFPAAIHIFNVCYSATLANQKVVDSVQPQISEVESLSKNMRSTTTKAWFNRSLASLNRVLGRHDVVKTLLSGEMRSGFDLLSDDDNTNDHEGFSTMALVLTHAGDDLNAMSAWSLIGPPERYDGFGQYLGPCDCHTCGTGTAGNSYWVCKICPDVFYHDQCLQKLKKGTLDTFICSPDHDWLWIPSIEEDFRETGKGYVRIGGEIRDGKREGGRILPVKEWLDTIREDWGIEKFD